MRIELTVRGPTHGDPDRDVVVECERGTSAVALARALGGRYLVVLGRPLPIGATVGSPPLLHGAVVSLDPAELRVASPWELRVVAGPDVGLRYPLSVGTSVIGRAEDAEVHVTDPHVSRRHAAVDVGPTGPAVVDLAGANGSSVCGVALGRVGRSFAVGDVVELGATRLQLYAVPRDSSRAHPDGEGHLLVSAPAPRRLDRTVEVRFPDPPDPPARSRVPWVALAVPLVMAAAVAAVMRSPTMLLFGLTGPLLSLGTWWAERRRRSRRRDDREQAAVAERACEELTAALVGEREEWWQQHPSLADVLVAAETRSPLLWSSGGTEVRVGVGRRRSLITVRGDAGPPIPEHEDVPVTVDLSSVGVLGLCGSPGTVVSVVGRLATQTPPSGVALFAVVRDPGGALAALLRRLPHTRALVGPAQAARVAGEVLAEIASREEADRVRAPPDRPQLVVVVDGWSAEADATWGVVRRRGPAVGVVLVVWSAAQSRLPAACGAVLVAGRDTSRLSVGDQVVDLVADRPGDEWGRRLASALAPLREARSDPASAPLPPSVRLLDLVGETDASRLARAWTEAGQSTRAVLGLAAGGRFEVDLAVDGPHALVAGTTGAGKSELLQTLVCSLALVNRPDELTFLLVDYKGGAAFRDCARLPHVVGVVTDLDGPLTARALTSLTAELRRRERRLRDAGAATLDEYRRRRAGDVELPPLPRVVIVIDEFRVLAEELPDFVHGLVRIAAVGRSLGVHLVLATQRPGGVVTADIRANVSLRIALRVRDRVDSVDVLDAADATRIDAGTPGRAFLRGAATPLIEFQSARVTSGARGARPLTVTPIDRARRTAAPATAGPPTGAPWPEGPRDVDRLVAATTEAARALDIPAPRSPWLAPLPDSVGVGELGVAPALDMVPLGLEDDPGAQAQRAWCWRIDDGHLGVAGGSRSGRTSAVLTVVGQLVRVGSPAELHVYAVGPHPLQVLDRLPHVAAVADVDDVDHVRLVVERLTAVARGHETSGPRVLLVVDGWERLAALAHGGLAAEVRALLENTTGSRLRAVVTGGRAVLAGQLPNLFAQRLVLPLADPVELAMAGIPVKAVPAHQPPGRAVDARTHREMQVALPGELPREPPSPGRSEGPTPRHRTSADSAPGWPRPIRRLPDQVVLTDLERTSALPVGVRDGDLATCGPDPAAGDRRLLVHGPPRSGRTTTLEVVASGLVAAGYPVALLGARWSSGAPDGVVLAIDGGREVDPDRLIEVRRAHPDLAVVVDDSERLSGLPIEPVLLEIARRVDEDHGVIVVATSRNALEGRVGALATDLARAHTGVELWPTAAPKIPGRGLLRTLRAVERIQVARLSRR
ncbi:MAG TPA: FtsK/SpoIIIE domain-containing protein [Lapillicoccus sp.]|nr:FtsK/SpoIIIE domain-containing protein [Lapillicoccus sp.]